MSHGKQRKEKNCLNCGTIVAGHFCQNCGQENIEPQETLWQMIVHFFNDITHFDGKFFPTVKYLFSRPGFLSEEYVKGRRARYLHPVRMYVFTNFLFFLVFFSLGYKNIDLGGITVFSGSPASIAEYEKLDSIYSNLPREEQQRIGDSLLRSRKLAEVSGDSIQIDSSLSNTWLGKKTKDYTNVVKSGREGKVWSDYVNAFMHRLPYVLMVSLPFFAFILQFVYRSKTKMMYYNHAVFSIHFFVLTFVIGSIGIVSLYFYKHYHAGFFWFLNLFVFFFCLFYLLFALKYFYRQGWVKTTFKWILICWMALFLFLFVAMLFGIVQLFFTDFSAGGGGH